MPQLYGLDHVRIGLLDKCKDLNIESVLSTCDKTLSFSYPYIEAKKIKHEMYIRTQADEFVVKEIEEGDSYTNFKAVLNVENLIGKDWDRFTNVQPGTVEATIRLALAGTGWSLKVNGTITKKRLVKKNMCSSWDLLQEIKKIFLIEYHFDTINKIVNVYEKIGSDKGVYIMEGLNLQKIDIQSHSHDYATKLVAYGKGDLKVEVTNNTYSNKQLTAIWKDERYTVEADLREDAQAKLDDMAVPYKAYKADIIDLAKVSDKYSLLEYSLGDTITLISKEYGIKEKQRIVKITEYPYEPEKNSVDIANVILTFENKQKEFQDATDTVSNITEDNYTISDNAIKASVHSIIVDTIDVNEINAIIGRFGTLEASVAHIQDLTAVNAIITDLKALKAEVGDLSAVNAKITNLEAKTAQFDTTLSHFLSAGSTQTLHLTSGNVVIDDAVIKSAMIESLSAGKITSGYIDTNLVQVKSTNGHMLIDGTTIQISDVNRIRVQIGEDRQHDYNIYIWDRAGNLMFDGINGLYDHGVKSKVIRNDMVKDDANISASKLDIGSLFSAINADGTHTLNSAKVKIDDTGQTLDVAFKKLNTTIPRQIRYIRDSQKGSTTNTSCHWNEIKALKGTTNLALNKPVTSSFQTSDIHSGSLTQVTDGKVSNTMGEYLDCNGDGTTWKYVQVDLGAVVDVDSIQVYHYWDNSRRYNFKLEVSKDGTEWFTLYDSDNTGKYLETQEGKSFFMNKDESLDVLQTSLHVEQGRIDQLIKDTQIVKDGTTTKLVDAYNQTVSTVNSINTTIASHTTAINTANSKISAVETKATTIEKNLEGVTTRVSSTETHITGLGTRVSSAESTITQHTTQIGLKASQTSVDGLTTRMASAESKITPTAIINTVSSTYATKTEVTQTENSWTARFTDGFGGNLLVNSRPNKASGTSSWSTSQGAGITNSLSISDGTELPGIQGGLRWNANRPNNSYSLVVNTSLHSVKFDTGSKYSLSISIFSSAARKVLFQISDGNSTNIVWKAEQQLNQGYQTLHYTFTPTVTGNTPEFMISDEGTGSNFFFIPWVTLLKSETPVMGYLANINELHDGNTSIDKNGVTIINGGLTLKNKAGSTILGADANGNLEMNVFDAHFKMAATGHRAAEMWCDIKDTFHIQVDDTNEGSGLLINTKKGQTLLEWHPLQVDKNNGFLYTSQELRLPSLILNGSGVVSGGFQVKGNLTVSTINGKAYVNSSSVAFKDEIEDTVALEMVDIVKNNSIKHYKYKDDEKREKKTGLILEHLTEEARYLLNPSETEGIDIYAMLSVLWETVRYQQNLIEELSKRIAA